MEDLACAIEAVWRIESARLIASLTRLTGDLGAAEDLAQGALLAALEQWPAAGVPRNPGAWLMAAARNRGIDRIRHEQRAALKHQELGLDLDQRQRDAAARLEATIDEDVGDDLLRLLFIACHPAISSEARVALTLRLLCGLSTAEIARAFLSNEPTIAQRIVRAKRTLAELRAPFELPRGEALTERLGSVLEVIYLVFNEGYAATSGAGWTRPTLCEDALRLGRVLAGLCPEEPEVHGLVALMELQASRMAARVGPRGEPVLLMDQNRARWDGLLIRRGMAALLRGLRLTDPARGRPPGPYLVQAAIAACHARARAAEDTDWERIAALYDTLALVAPSPVVALNRAVAVSQARGPAEALVLVDDLVASGALDGYHLLLSVRADLLARLGRVEEARAELLRAADQALNEAERTLLLERARAI